MVGGIQVGGPVDIDKDEWLSAGAQSLVGRHANVDIGALL